MTSSHDVEWTEEKVARFWDDKSQRAEGSYFSAEVAPALASWISREARPGKFVVDVGCGPGHLLTELAKRGFHPLGVDNSPESLRLAAARVGESNVALGSVTNIPVASGAAEGLLVIETIEHILDADLEIMMDEIRRVLGRGAPLVITTPNSENLEASKVRCPDCGARFHPIQHVRSWNPPGLEHFLREHGFSRVQTFQTRLPVGPLILGWPQRVFFRLRKDRRHLLAVARS